MNAIALAEVRMLGRNHLVGLCALLLPLLVAFALFRLAPTTGFEGSLAALQIMALSATGLYVTATTTLAGRRQTLYLKRLRSGVISDASVLAGLVVPLVVINLVQIVAVLLFMSWRMTPPDQWLLVVVAVVSAELMFVAFALATSGVTNSPEHAQVTSLPVYMGTIIVAGWVAITGTGEMTWVKLALPGGAIAELSSVAWGGTSDVPTLLLVLATAGWVVLASVFAWRMFRWEPRR